MEFVDQEAVLAESDVVISHAGSGTVLGALKRALPTVSLPLGADQLLNAARLHSLGLGMSMTADTATVWQVRDAVEAVLASASIRRNLEAVRTEIDALPDEAHALAAVVELGYCIST
jgi:UDP:flavonoid glycosyltransferase YjiC (YdhE family)